MERRQVIHDSGHDTLRTAGKSIVRGGYAGNPEAGDSAEDKSGGDFASARPPPGDAQSGKALIEQGREILVERRHCAVRQLAQVAQQRDQGGVGTALADTGQQ
jgi:hypothetical protein